jgi:hypothetical protein
MIISMGSTCEDDNWCGPSDDAKKQWHTENIDLTPNRRYEGLNNEFVVYSFFIPTVNDVCPDEHVSVHMAYSIRDTARNQVVINAAVTYGVLYEYPFNNFEIETSGTLVTYLQIGSIGLKQLYQSDPGWFLPWFDIKFSSKGSAELDDQWLKANFTHIRIDCYYRLYPN